MTLTASVLDTSGQDACKTISVFRDMSPTYVGVCLEAILGQAMFLV
jgi:hypothetical protein